MCTAILIEILVKVTKRVERDTGANRHYHCTRGSVCTSDRTSLPTVTSHTQLGPTGNQKAVQYGLLQIGGTHLAQRKGLAAKPVLNGRQLDLKGTILQLVPQLSSTKLTDRKAVESEVLDAHRIPARGMG